MQKRRQPTFHGTLREYQREALGWMRFLRDFGFGGCLADDMGLGKTVMVLAMLEARRLDATRAAPAIARRPAAIAALQLDERSVAVRAGTARSRFRARRPAHRRERDRGDAISC